MNERTICPYCFEPVSGETVTLWDDRIYCRTCVEKVSPDLYEFVTAGVRLEETVEKSDVSVSKFFKGAGTKFAITAFFVFMLPFLVFSILDNANALTNIVIGLSIFCGGFAIFYIVLKLVVVQNRTYLPRTVAVESGHFLITTPQEEKVYPLGDCKWKFGRDPYDELKRYASLRNGIIIYTPDAMISCGNSPDMLKHWSAFLPLAGVRRNQSLSWIRILTAVCAGMLSGCLIGWSIGHVVVIITNNNRWIFMLSLLGGFDGIFIASMYAFRRNAFMMVTYKAYHPIAIGVMFLLLGVKIGRLGGIPGMLICGSINTLIGILAAWFCRSQIRADELQSEVEEQFRRGRKVDRAKEF